MKEMIRVEKKRDLCQQPVGFSTVYSSTTRVLTARRHVYTSVPRLSTSRQNNDVLLIWISNAWRSVLLHGVRSPVRTTHAIELFSCGDRTRNGGLNTAQPLPRSDGMIYLLASRCIRIFQSFLQCMHTKATGGINFIYSIWTFSGAAKFWRPGQVIVTTALQGTMNSVQVPGNCIADCQRMH